MERSFIPEEWIFNHHPIDDIEPNLPHENGQNGHLPPELITNRTAIDDLEPDHRRQLLQAREKCVELLNNAFSHIEPALLNPGCTKRDVAVAFYQTAYAMGLNLCDGMTMTQRAEIWGVERASISKGATAFCAGNALSPSFHMKKEQAQSSYRKARIVSIKQNGLCKQSLNGH